MIRVTQAQAAHFGLRKNYLIAAGAGVTEVVAGLAGLPAQPELTPFLSLLARLPDFKPLALLAAEQNRQVARLALFRSQPYWLPLERLPTFFAATARQRRQSLNSDFRLWGIENSEVEQVGQAILALVETTPLPAEEIAGRLDPALRRELSQTSRGGRASTTTNVALALEWLAGNGQLYAARDPALGQAWRQDRLRYGSFRSWFPELDLTHLPDEASAQTAVVRAYLATFGPASEADISFWTGFGKSETARAVSALSGETTLVLVEGIPGITVLLKSQAEVLSAGQPADEPVVNILPADDPFTTAHRASRNRYLAQPSWQRLVFSNAGNAKPTIVVNGQMVGVWQETVPEESGGRVRLTWQPLLEVEPGLAAKIQEKLSQVETFLNLA
jgi:hypothetical protein